MQENGYIINGLKKEDSKRVKEHFSKHLSFFRLRTCYRGLDGYFALGYSQVYLSYFRAGKAIEYRVVPFRQITSYSVTSIDSQNIKLKVWLVSGDIFECNFSENTLKDIVKVFPNM